MSLCLMCKEIKESDLPFSKVNQVNKMLSEHPRGSSVQKVGMSHCNRWKTWIHFLSFSQMSNYSQTKF